jgi:hypothetical protein
VTRSVIYCWRDRCIALLVVLLVDWTHEVSAAPAVLDPALVTRHVGFFNAMEDEPVVNAVPNGEAAAWLQANIPLFASPDADFDEIYYFRWWAMRKHLRIAPDGSPALQGWKGYVFTEFINRAQPVSSALGHHLMEGRWLHDSRLHDDYVRYWLRGDGGRPFLHRHSFGNYSSWLQFALYERYLVNRDEGFLRSVLEELVADYRTWEKEKQLASGLFWQFDVRDAMEESISGSRTAKNVRPPLNSYMFGNARALAAIARLVGRPDLAAEFEGKAVALRRLAQETLWHPEARFFQVRHESGPFANVREQIGFIPWYFHLPEPGKGYEEAWSQLRDPQGFRAPYGLTTAERRHPEFRSHGIGTCEWDGAVWPFATAQTLTALANVLRDYPQTVVSRGDYFDALVTYARSHRYDGLPYLGEYQDETTGLWLKGRNPRSRWYNHSTFADLVITGLVGLRPRADNVIEVDPLLPEKTWPWFCLDNVRYHGRTVTILWDRDGTRFGRGAGLLVLVDGREVARGAKLERVLVTMQ